MRLAKAQRLLSHAAGLGPARAATRCCTHGFLHDFFIKQQYIVYFSGTTYFLWYSSFPYEVKAHTNNRVGKPRETPHETQEE